MKTCPKCGETNANSARHCAKCGESLSGVQARQGLPPSRVASPMLSIADLLRQANSYISCPECSKPTNSLKQYRLVETLLFMGIGGAVRHETRTACPSCMRKILLRRIFSWHILTGNVLWLLVSVPYHLALMVGTLKKGHSKKLLQAWNWRT